MTQSIAPIRGTTKNYGRRHCGGANGQYRSDGPLKSLTFKINKEFLQDAKDGVVKLNSFLYPNSSVVAAKVIVYKAFSADATFKIIAKDSSGTLEIPAGDLQTVNSRSLTPIGKLAVDSIVVDIMDLEIKDVVVGDLEGAAEVIIEYTQTAVSG